MNDTIDGFINEAFRMVVEVIVGLWMILSLPWYTTLSTSDYG